MAELVDYFLLGLVDCLVSVCRIVYRSGFKRANYPAILRPNTLAALETLQQHGVLDTEDAEFLCESYQFLRRVEARLRLLNTTARHDLPREGDELAKLAYLLRYDASAKLEAECARYTKQNRRLFDKWAGEVKQKKNNG